ncbi:MAG: replication-associated recombination protein A [Clostridia bacterium]
MDIFTKRKNEFLKENAPLADRLRPKRIEEFVGQEHILGKGKLLNRAIKADRLSSMIFYGPPGTGKTTLAKIIANNTSRSFEQLNAVMAGVKDIKEVIARAENRLGTSDKKTILFIDEIHRFNKSQQDALLPSVESGVITLIGATTENPYFEVNPPLLSRSQIFEFRQLTEENIKEIILRAVQSSQLNSRGANVVLKEDALNHLVKVSAGDARIAINALELAVMTTEADESDNIVIDLDIAEESIQKKSVRYDKNGDMHYDTISAFIKSMRGSDPDAAVYYLARMIEAGEDVRFIARRIVICASEDVGNADPQALVVANSAAQACDFVGFPEAQLILAQATIYVATAPKSNSVTKAIASARKAVRENNFSGIPKNLQDAHYKGAKKLNRGVGYKYPHDFDRNFVLQQYLPDSLKDEIFYKPTENGHEEKIREYLISIWSKKEV